MMIGVDVQDLGDGPRKEILNIPDTEIGGKVAKKGVGFNYRYCEHNIPLSYSSCI